jgi:hypothetical protein
MTMATKKSVWFLFGILMISAWVLGSVTQVGAVTLNYKNYTYVTKAESFPVEDVDGHTVDFRTRRAFLVFEDGEVATQSSVIIGDTIKGSSSNLQYSTITFSDGSTIIMKRQVTMTGTAPGVFKSAKTTSEIIKGNRPIPRN